MTQARLQRRLAFEVRRDAAQELTNGRVVYDALLSKAGWQQYPGSVEYRPASEVFDAASLASLANLPGVLLHPDANFGTSFGEGSYPVRGTTGSNVVEHTDAVHTSGQLIVWDAEWNALIQTTDPAENVSELSLGYTITPGPAEMIDGRQADVVHTKIIGDHAAGVPEGNAETARVVLDARSRLATRHALAEIASMRMDARPLHFDLGRGWPRRDTKDTDRMATAKTPPTPAASAPRLDAFKTKLDAATTPEQRIDAFVDVWGEHDDPGMKAALGALAGAPGVNTPAPVSAPAVVEPIADAEDDEDPDKDEDEDAVVAASERADAIQLDRWRYADALELARRAHGQAFTGLGTDGRTDRKDAATSAPLSLEALRLSVVRKVDAKTGDRLDRLDANDRRGALGLAFEQARDVLDESAKSGPKLAAAINEGRVDAGAENDTKAVVYTELSKQMQQMRADAAQANFGAAPATP